MSKENYEAVKGEEEREKQMYNLSRSGKSIPKLKGFEPSAKMAELAKRSHAKH
jgi:hypothetical protein